MSNISDIYDKILSKMETLYPNHTRIPRAESLPDNIDKLLTKGYGLKFNSMIRVEHEFQNIAFEFEFGAVFTREIISHDVDTDPKDTGYKEILEDIVTFGKNFYDVTLLGISDKIENIDIVSSTGVETVLTDNYRYWSSEVSFTVQIREKTLSC